MALSDGKRRLVGRLTTRKTRAREGLVLVEGVRAVGEAMDAAVRVRFALRSPYLASTPGGPELAERLAAADHTVEEVSERELADVSDTRTPQGVLLVCEEPDTGLDALPAGRYVLLDGVQDPGNVGTMVRTARAFGLDGVVVLDGSADPWSPKAVRGSAGSCLHIRVAVAKWSDVRAWASRSGVRLLAGDPGGHDVSSADSSGSWGLVIGSEGAGIRPEILDEAELVAVPMAGGADSLNAAVAGAILLYALTTPEKT